MKLSSRFLPSPQFADPDPPLKRSVTSVTEALRNLLRVTSRLDDEHFAKHALLRIQKYEEQLQLLCQGKLVFDSTETWRTVYEDVLSSSALKRYLSVALVRTEEYWRDTPGDRSIRFNGMLVDYGFYVHRIAIIDDFLWPPLAALPSKELHTWIHCQYTQGIQIGLVRVSELSSEGDLISDFGIYGETAVGYQLTGDIGQTVRYEMHFGPHHVQAAEDRWKRLSLYARPLESI